MGPLTKKERGTHTPLHFQHIAHWGLAARPGSGRILAGRGQNLRKWELRMPVTDTDVIIVGAAPTGLMLAGELCLAGVRPLGLERLPQIRGIPKAGGLAGVSLQPRHYRGRPNAG